MATTTFNEIERKADKTFAYAILARFASNYVTCVYRSGRTCRSLEVLLGVLVHEKLELLTGEQTQWLTNRLQELHRLLADFARSHEAETIKGLPVLKGLVTKIQDATEDIGDVVENLVLSKDDEFRSLIEDCAVSIGLSGGETVARMRG